VNGIDEPKGVIYIDVGIDDDSQFDIAEMMRMALGWSSDQATDSSKRNYSNSFLLLEANKFAAASLWEVLQVLSRHATKYKQEYEKIPVLIIDNANKLAQRQPKLLDLFQDYAKNAADNGLVSVVFVSSEGRVPRRMMGKSIMFTVLSVNDYMLIKYYREKLVVKKWRNHRNWRCEQGGSSSVPQTPEDR
jgi:hypothetical protein